jgi:hypothetical protein
MAPTQLISFEEFERLPIRLDFDPMSSLTHCDPPINGDVFLLVLRGAMGKQGFA